jgi:hypothetical protein
MGLGTINVFVMGQDVERGGDPTIACYMLLVGLLLCFIRREVGDDLFFRKVGLALYPGRQNTL